MKIAVDVMGGDKAPKAIILGILLALKWIQDVVFILVGDPVAIKKYLPKGYDQSRIEIVPATDQIRMGEKVDNSIRSRKNSSLYIAISLVRDGLADAVVSCGNTAAYVALSQLRLGRIAGFERPALAAILPGNKIFLDVGANVDSTPEIMYTWAIAASIYAKKVLGKLNPLVRILSIGSELDEAGQLAKGDSLTKLTHGLLTKLARAGGINFGAEPIEADDLLSDGEVAVILADGFPGNATLKALEGVVKNLKSKIFRMIKKKPWLWPLVLLAIPFLLVLSRYLEIQFGYTRYNGAPLLGVNGVVVKGHGKSSALAVYFAILAAVKAVRNNLINEIKTGLEAIESE